MFIKKNNGTYFTVNEDIYLYKGDFKYDDIEHDISKIELLHNINTLEDFLINGMASKEVIREWKLNYYL